MIVMIYYYTYMIIIITIIIVIIFMIVIVMIIGYYWWKVTAMMMIAAIHGAESFRGPGASVFFCWKMGQVASFSRKSSFTAWNQDVGGFKMGRYDRYR